MSRNHISLSVAATLLGGAALADAPRVAVDIGPVHSLVARVMQGVGTPDLIIQSGASPHEYSLRPSEAQALQDADLVIWVGPDLTAWLGDTIETLATDATSIELLESDGTIELEFRESALFEAHDHEDHDEDGHEGDHKEEGHDDHGDEDHKDGDHGDGDHKEDDDHDNHDHAEEGHDDHANDKEGHEGHDHGAHDPHAWLSPQNAMTWMNTIAGQLSAADPENAGAYFANASAGRAEIETLIGEINATLAPVRGGKFVVFHDAYQYFESSFDFPASGAISLSDASDPSPARITEIKDRIAAEGITCVLSEPQFNAGLVRTVLDGTKAQTGILDPLGSDLEAGAALYPQLLRNLSTALAGCLK